ncbi:hypothetical protein CY652_06375 [Burkholderia sp. WAC0059]|uniref:cytochrome oxidase putative small subunit CydP n=1 Tax=Burkholderia sp. WAC0059 TaxID=2066022 RepID=UPI000C7EF3FD|nr:cytochrome oxidase putative small subunit CydP [Burkholderia sp. WAC0059]PLZ03427.1 hypothetical protein CY652_06375 [Burkholderia sp. WAC0059]
MASPSDRRRRPGGSLRERLARWSHGPSFAHDLAVVLAFKLVLLMALKYAFFNHPQAKDMSMPPASVAEAILSVPAPNTPPPGDSHAH